MAKKTAKPAAKAKKAPAAKAKPMTKKEMMEALAEATGFTQICVADTYAALLDLVATETKKNGEFKLHGLGKFRVVQCKERPGRNPHTKQPTIIPARPAVKISLSKIIKDAILG